MSRTDYDLCVIGGGINGAGIARDAAGRGLSVLLLEAGDLAGATSSASTKLVHGGLRYLEYYEFKLVRESLQERARLHALAPHIIRPLRFVLPHDEHLRPAWMIRAGLFLYDRLGGGSVFERSRRISFGPDSPLRDHYKFGFAYADGWVEDARLVVLNALDAQERGARVLVRAQCTSLRPQDGVWHIEFEGRRGPAATTARMVVNAAGPWTREILDHNKLAHEDTPGLRLVRGSHLIVRRTLPDDHAYILQQPDKRIVFAIPYERDFTLVGTTDAPQDHMNEPPAISAEETQYLIDAYNRSFSRPIAQTDIAQTYSGVRALVDDGQDNASAVTRDYRLVLDDHDGAKILSVFGGKITTYRALAEEAVNKLSREKPWTIKASLPGGDLPGGSFTRYLKQARERWAFLPEELCHRYARAYGTRMEDLIGPAQSLAGLGVHYGDDVYEAELRYLIEVEWARTDEDILWRRSKLALHVTPETAAAIAQAVPEFVKEMTGL